MASLPGQMKIGLIGIGRMGRPIALRMLAAGVALAVYDREPAALQGLEEHGAVVAASPEALAQACDVIMLCLPDHHAVEAVVAAILPQLTPGKRVVDLSTIDFGVAERMAAVVAEKGATYIDMPVSGGRRGGIGDAEQGDLTAIWGGPPDALDGLEPAVQAFSSRIRRMGGTGSGQMAKLINNLLASIVLTVTVEGLVLGAKAGVDPRLLLDVIQVSSGNSAMLGIRKEKLLVRDFDNVMHPLTGRLKDVEAALALARRHFVPAPLSDWVRSVVLSALRHGDGGLDAAALIRVYERLSGYTLPSVPPRSVEKASFASGARDTEAPVDPRELTVGFIGLGRMGKGMASVLAKAGIPLFVYNRSKQPVQELVELGATAATSPADLARNVDVIITCLHINEAVEAVYFGPDGLLSGVRPGAVLVDTGTTSLALTRRIAEAAAAKQAGFVDAPISGGPPRAATGELTIMAGGSDETFAKAAPVLRRLASQLFHMGGVGSGQVTKQVNNLMTVGNYAAFCEAFAIARAAGLDLLALHDVVQMSSGGSQGMTLRGMKALTGDRKVIFTVEGRIKDSQAALELGRVLHVPLPLTALIHELLQAPAAWGLDQEDWTRLADTYEALANVRFVP